MQLGSCADFPNIASGPRQFMTSSTSTSDTMPLFQVTHILSGISSAVTAALGQHDADDSNSHPRLTYPDAMQAYAIPYGWAGFGGDLLACYIFHRISQGRSPAFLDMVLGHDGDHSGIRHPRIAAWLATIQLLSCTVLAVWNLVRCSRGGYTALVLIGCARTCIALFNGVLLLAGTWNLVNEDPVNRGKEPEDDGPSASLEVVQPAIGGPEDDPEAAAAAAPLILGDTVADNTGANNHDGGDPLPRAGFSYGTLATLPGFPGKSRTNEPSVPRESADRDDETLPLFRHVATANDNPAWLALWTPLVLVLTVLSLLTSGIMLILIDFEILEGSYDPIDRRLKRHADRMFMALCFSLFFIPMQVGLLSLNAWCRGGGPNPDTTTEERESGGSWASGVNQAMVILALGTAVVAWLSNWTLGLANAAAAATATASDPDMSRVPDGVDVSVLYWGYFVLSKLLLFVF
ncbi:hypothetical protein V8F06_013163 [Rhypophila decipiens]